MSLINEKGICKLTAWAEKNENKHIFPQPSSDVMSYYIDRDSEETYMIQYSPLTEKEIKDLLGQYSVGTMDSCLLRELTLMICLNKFRDFLEGDMIESGSDQSIEMKSDKRILPEFVYVF